MDCREDPSTLTGDNDAYGSPLYTFQKTDHGSMVLLFRDIALHIYREINPDISRS